MYRRGRNSGNGFFVLIMLLIFAPGLVGGIISGIMPLVVLGVVGATLFSVFKGIFSGAERKETVRQNTRGKTVNKKRSTLSNADIVRIDSKLSEYFKHNYALAVIDDVSLVLSGGAYSSVDKLYVTYKDEKVVRLGEFKDSYPEMYDKILSLLNAFSKQSEEVLKSKPQTNVRKEDVLSDADKYIEKLSELKNHGASLAWICTLDGAGIAEKAGLPFASGFGMNVFNTLSVCSLEALGARDCLISCEMKLSDTARLGGSVPRGAIVCGRIPLMLTRNCPIKNRLSCAECKSSSKLVDRMGIEFPVICKNGASFILNSRPLSLADKLNELRGIDFGLIYFTNESSPECEKILGEVREGISPQGEFTRGLYYKNVY